MSSSDFEVLPVGTITEVRLARELAHAIERAQRQGPVPDEIIKAYAPLRGHHQKMIAQEQGG